MCPAAASVHDERGARHTRAQCVWTPLTTYWKDNKTKHARTRAKRLELTISCSVFSFPGVGPKVGATLGVLSRASVSEALSGEFVHTFGADSHRFWWVFFFKRFPSTHGRGRGSAFGRARVLLVGDCCVWEPLLFSVGGRSSTVVRLCCGRSAHFDCVSLRLGAKRDWTVSSSPLAELILLWVLQKHGAERRGGPLGPPPRSRCFPPHHTPPSAKTLL